MIDKIKNKINSDIHFKELLKGSSIAFVLRIIGIIAGYIFTILITRWYGAETMGIFTLSFTFLQVFSMIGRLGIDTTLLKFVAEYSSQGKKEIIIIIYKKAIKFIIPFSIFLSVFAFISSKYIAEIIFRKSFLASYFSIASLGIISSVLLFLHAECLRGLKKIKEYIFFQQTGTLLLSSLFLALIILISSIFSIKKADYPIFWSYEIPIVVYILSLYILSILSYVIWVKNVSHLQIKETFNKSWDKSLRISSILRLSIPMFLSNSISLIMSWIDVIMLGIFRTEQEVGIYSVIIKIGNIPLIIFTSINSIAAPKYAECMKYNKDIEIRECLYKIGKRSTKLIFIFSSLVIMLIFMLKTPILLSFGKEFIKFENILLILLLFYIINMFLGNPEWILKMTNFQQYHQNILIISLFINIALNILLIPWFGVMGAIIATSISSLFWKLVYSYKVYKEFNIFLNPFMR